MVERRGRRDILCSAVALLDHEPPKRQRIEGHDALIDAMIEVLETVERHRALTASG